MKNINNQIIHLVIKIYDQSNNDMSQDLIDSILHSYNKIDIDVKFRRESSEIYYFFFSKCDLCYLSIDKDKSFIDIEALEDDVIHHFLEFRRDLLIYDKFNTKINSDHLLIDKTQNHYSDIYNFSNKGFFHIDSYMENYKRKDFSCIRELVYRELSLLDYKEVLEAVVNNKNNCDMYNNIIHNDAITEPAMNINPLIKHCYDITLNNCIYENSVYYCGEYRRL